MRTFKDKHSSTFIWNNKVPWIRKELLEIQKEDGDLAMNNYLYYYWVANIHKVTFWALDLSDDESPVWSLKEKFLSNPVSLRSLICGPLPLSKRHWTNMCYLWAAQGLQLLQQVGFGQSDVCPQPVVLPPGALQLLKPGRQPTAGSWTVCV